MGAISVFGKEKISAGPVTPLYVWRRCHDHQSAHRMRQGHIEFAGRLRHDIGRGPTRAGRLGLLSTLISRELTPPPTSK